MVSRRSHLRKAEARGAREHWDGRAARQWPRRRPHHEERARCAPAEAELAEAVVETAGLPLKRPQGSSWALRRCASPARALRR